MCLNAPYGARCLLTELRQRCLDVACSRLNAPFGALRFLTEILTPSPMHQSQCLNAPYGALRFLTQSRRTHVYHRSGVLMHLMAHGAFSREGRVFVGDGCDILILLMVLGAFSLNTVNFATSDGAS